MNKINFDKIIPILENSNVKTAGVFGSYSKKEKNPNDLDILIELNKPIGLFKFIGLQDELSQKLNFPVDLVTKKFLSPYLKKQILKETKIFYER